MDTIDTILLGQAAGSAARMSRQLGELKGDWANAVAQLARDKERMAQELIEVGADRDSLVAVVKAMIAEVKEIDNNPMTPRLYLDPNNKDARNALRDKVIEERTKALRVSVSRVYG